MSEHGHELREGQPVWHKGRPAVFLYYVRESGAAIRFEGRPLSKVVSTEFISTSPPDENEESAA